LGTFLSRFQDVPEVVKVVESALFLLANLLYDPHKAVRDSIFSPVNANNIGVQITPPFYFSKTLYHDESHRLVTD
jgi:hypothetical protein